MSATKSVADPVAALKEAHRAMWADGDYSAVARLMEDVPPHMLSAVGVATIGCSTSRPGRET